LKCSAATGGYGSVRREEFAEHAGDCTASGHSRVSTVHERELSGIVFIHTHAQLSMATCLVATCY